MTHFLMIVAYLLAVAIVSLDFIRYIVWTLPTVSRFDYHAVRDTIMLIGCQLLARLFIMGFAGRAIL